MIKSLILPYEEEWVCPNVMHEHEDTGKHEMFCLLLEKEDEMYVGSKLLGFGWFTKLPNGPIEP